MKMDKFKVKGWVGSLPGGRRMLFLYKRIHVFLRDVLLPDLKAGKWRLKEDAWVTGSAVPPPRSAQPVEEPAQRLTREDEEMFRYMMSLRDELEGFC